MLRLDVRPRAEVLLEVADGACDELGIPNGFVVSGWGYRGKIDVYMSGGGRGGIG